MGSSHFVRRHRAVVICVFAFLACGWLYGQEALHIDDKGNIGIGTTKPQASLDVSGNARFLSGSNPLLIAPAWDNFADPSVTENNRAEIANDAGDYKSLMLVGNKSGDGKTRVVSVWDRLVVNGSLGIGTKTGAGKFQIQNGTYDLLTGLFTVDIGLGGKPENESWARAFRVVNSSGSDGKDGGAFGVLGVGKTPGYAYMAIPTKDAAGYDSDKILVLNNAGNVGIGTRGPEAKLDVNGSAIIRGSDSAELLLKTADKKGLTLRYMTVGTEQKSRIGFKGLSNWILWSEANSGNAYIYGNLGLGTETAEKKLDVRGEAIINGDLTITGSLVLSNMWKVYPVENGSGLMFSHNNKGIFEMRDGQPFLYNMDGKFWALGFGSVLHSTATWTESDARLKTDVFPISSALDKVNKLTGVTYHWNQHALDYFTRDIERAMSAGPDATPEGNQKVWQEERQRRYKELANRTAGVIAQDVEAVLPEAVTMDEAGYKQVAYHELIPLLIQAVKEEDSISKEQAQTIARQALEIQRLAAANQAARQQLSELQELKLRLAYLEGTMDKLVHTKLSETSNGKAGTVFAAAATSSSGSDEPSVPQ